MKYKKGEKLLKILLIILGFIFLSVGLFGIAVPILPTTPFLLLAFYCFVNSSTKLSAWFIETKIYKKYLEDFINEKAMTKKQKYKILIFVDLIIFISFINLENLHAKIFLILLFVIKNYYFLFKIKTIE